MLSASGRCRAFDAAADGYVRAEGGAVLLLKPLDKALADGNSSIRHSRHGDQHGWRSQDGITIPSGEGQADLLREVLGRSGLSADEMITSRRTAPARPSAIRSRRRQSASLCRHRARSQPLPIGSVKTNLGHLESASGMADW